VKRSTERFLTTHTGSLPRPEDLIRTMFAKEEGVPVDAAALAARIRSAVAEVVRKQTEAGLDVVDDGEMSKPSYATYPKDRLTGFGGASHPLQYRDLVDFPGMARRVFGDPGRARRKTPACTGPIAVGDRTAADVDAANLRAALTGAGAQEGFLTAASPGVISLFFRDEYYGSHEKYLFAIAEAMRHEYETIASAGVTLQVDCPDLAMGRHVQFTHLSLADFRKRIGMNVAALNHALQNIPAEQLRMHLCWGNYPGPHTCDVDLGDIADIVWSAKPQTVLLEGANPRHAHEFAYFAQHKLPEGKVLCPGMIEPQSPYVEHPELIAQRIERFAAIVGLERVIASTDCGFGTFAGYGKIDPVVTWKKLGALREGADIAADRL
jgi:5-methyltetrahydropteroyltriglutamate--homocysteine methyltransferase